MEQQGQKEKEVKREKPDLEVSKGRPDRPVDRGHVDSWGVPGETENTEREEKRVPRDQGERGVKPVRGAKKDPRVIAGRGGQGD